MARTLVEDECPIIALDRFIQATRDSGYKGTASAISELVDNSLQAGAKNIAIKLTEVDGEHSIVVSIRDDGCGMDPFTLRQALQFGGSTRFGDRSGLGRYGMGLPNSSLSQAQRVTVYTWQSLARDSRGRGVPGRRTSAPDAVYASYLDVDEIASGTLCNVPTPHVTKNPPPECEGSAGTMVVWERCDRLDNRRISTISRKLALELGRRFRHFIWDGIRITINGTALKAIDPLFLHEDCGEIRGKLYGEELQYEVVVDPDDSRKGTGTIQVRFVELPVREWQKLSNDQKRQRGISKGAGVSLVRGGREVDYGWFFMGEKRRENYDDWWRCEIRFCPLLDEAFGITHTKQQVRPKAYLLEALTPDLEQMARVLNSHVRKAHLSAKESEQFEEAEQLANARGRKLRPLPAKSDKHSRALITELKKQHPELAVPVPVGASTTDHVIIKSPLRETCFFDVAHEQGRLVLILNPDHPFYRCVYQILAESDDATARALRVKLELLLLAAARSEITIGRKYDDIMQHRLEWSNILATFLTG